MNEEAKKSNIKIGVIETVLLKFYPTEKEALVFMKLIFSEASYLMS